MKSYENSTLAILAGVGAVMAPAIYVFLGGTADYAIAAVSVLFAVALIPGIVECYRKKFGWSKRSTTMTGFGLLSMGAIFLKLGLLFTGLSEIVSATMWMILLVQAFIYAKPAVSPAKSHYNVFVRVDENEGSTLERGTLIVQVFDANSPEIEAKATSVIKAALESMR